MRKNTEPSGGHSRHLSNASTSQVTTNRDNSSDAGKSKIEMQLKKIMQMVVANSQFICIYGLMINSLENQPCFVQILHNTDDDSLILMLISDFKTFKVTTIDLKQVKHPLWLMIYHRFG